MEEVCKVSYSLKMSMYIIKKKMITEVLLLALVLPLYVILFDEC